jgi:hypothetical protein
MAAFIPALISGVAGLAGGLLNKPKTVTQNQNSTTNTNSDQSANQSLNATPTYDPMQLAMRNYLLGQYFQRSQPGQVDSLVKGYVNSGVNNINDSASTNEQVIKNMLASRGLSYSGAAGTSLGMAESNRIGQISALRNSAPLIGDNLQRQNLTDFSGFLSGLPTGQSSVSDAYSQNHSSSHTEGVGTATDPGNVAGGAVSGLGSSLAYLYGKGAFGGKK